MGKKDKVVPIINQALEARQNFASHVQSIAFNLTLSRRMIDCLEAVRDYGWPHFEWEDKKARDDKQQIDSRTVNRVHLGTKREAFVSHNFVGFMKALSNRGLITWNQNGWDKRKVGERTVFLSRAGELTCDLLVEAGLMAPAVEARKKASK